MELLIVLGLILLLSGDSQSIGAMKKSTLQLCYIDGKLNKKLGLHDGKKQIGVYMIYKDGAPVYVGYSGSQLYKTFTRHFQMWNDRSQQRVTYSQTGQYKARIIFCNTARQAEALERAIILKINPRDNPNKYESYLITPYDTTQYKEYRDTTPAPF